jgi:hypothetical protein
VSANKRQHLSIRIQIYNNKYNNKIFSGMFDKIKAGLQNARNYLETAKDIADLVSESLRTKETENKRGDDADFTNKEESKPFEITNIITTFFRLLGLDSKKMTAVTVNSFIFFAQMVKIFIFFCWIIFIKFIICIHIYNLNLFLTDR